MNLADFVKYSASVADETSDEDTAAVLEVLHTELKDVSGEDLGHFLIDLLAYLAKHYRPEFVLFVALIVKEFGHGPTIHVDLGQLFGAFVTTRTPESADRTEKSER